MKRASVKNNPLADQYFDLPGLSYYASTSKDTLRDYIRCLGLPAFKVKGKLLVKRSEFDQWMEAHRVKGIDVDAIVKEMSK